MYGWVFGACPQIMMPKGCPGAKYNISTEYEQKNFIPYFC